MAQGWGTGGWGPMPWGGSAVAAISRYLKILRIKITDFLSIFIKKDRLFPNIEKVRATKLTEFKVRASSYNSIKIRITPEERIKIKSE